jgi:PAS domain-containing protein
MVLGVAHQPAAIPRQPASAVRVLVALGALALCGAVTWLAAWRADQSLRADLLQQARLVAQALDISRIQALSGSAADPTSPDYRQLKRQLIAIGQANPKCTWFYLMGRRPDGTVFFFVDSEPPAAEDPSPPGQVYEEVPADYRRVFDTKAEATVGPLSDRWGTWVTALVPLTARGGGALVAVLGMDIDAGIWRWDVAAEAAPLIGLGLVLLIGALAAVASSRRRDTLPPPILRRLLPPLAAMVTLLMLGAGALLWQQHRQRLAAEITADVTEVTGDLRVALEQQTALLNAYAETVVASPTLGRALRERDVEALLAAWQPEFERLRRDGGVTHFYVLDAQRLCLLRLHRPEQRGDRIERFTALAAERTGCTASGIELGSLGTFTLRVVHPVFDGATLLGYVELGREIEDVLQTLHTRSGNHVAVTLSKAVLERSAWESGMRALGREPEWDRLPDSVVAYASQGRLPDAFLPLLNPDSATAPARRTVDDEVLCNGKSWRVSTAPLQDASATVVGQLLVMRDITAAKAAFRRVLALGGTAGAVLLTLLLSSIYVLLRRTDAGIRAQQRALLESAESYRNRFAHNSAPMLLIDPADGALVDANAAAVAFYGHSREQLLALRIGASIPCPPPPSAKRWRRSRRSRAGASCSSTAWRTVRCVTWRCRRARSVSASAAFCTRSFKTSPSVGRQRHAWRRCWRRVTRPARPCSASWRTRPAPKPI